MEKPSVSVAVRFSRAGREQIWCETLELEGCDDGPADVARLKRHFLNDLEGSLGRTSSASSSAGGGANSGPSSRRHVAGTAPAVQLRVVPCRPSCPQVEVLPVQGQGLAAFLERSCREDNGIFQLRAVFDRPCSGDFVHVPIAFPGFTSSGGSSGSADPPAALVEQFELELTATVAKLKRLIQERTQLPTDRCILLHGQRRLHDQVSMQRATASIGTGPLVFHLATGGAYVLLRREGQGHREPFGPSSLTLLLPRCVQGARVRPMKFDPRRSLADLLWSIQAVSGLPPAGMRLTLPAIERRFLASDGTESLESLGFWDGCALEVEHDIIQETHHGDAFDMPLEVSAAGNASSLYQNAAKKLGLADASSLSLFVGKTIISNNAELSGAPLTDGTVLSAYISWSLQLSISVLPTGGTSQVALAAGFSAAAPSLATSASASSSASPSGGMPGSGPDPLSQPLAVLSSDTIAEVRERCIGALAASRPDLAVALRGSKVFATGLSAWTEHASECKSLAALARLLGHFAPCRDGARLSRLGVADGAATHLVFVPEQPLLVEIEVRIGGETRVDRRLRVPSTSRLMDMSRMLEQDLQAQPKADRPDIVNFDCQWSLLRADASSALAPAAAAADCCGSSAAGCSTSTVGAAVAALAGVVASGKRRLSGSFGAASGAAGEGGPAAKKQRTSDPLVAISDEEFVGDLHAAHPARQQDLERHYLCPISYEVMTDPVIVVGSGNTYDRKSIEQWLAERQTSDPRDPITNDPLRKQSERRLVPNHALRSQISEALRTQVDLRLVASIGERRSRSRSLGGRGSASGAGLALPGSAADGPDGASSSLRWCTSWLLGKQD